jgi:hypothetical protein
VVSPTPSSRSAGSTWPASPSTSSTAGTSVDGCDVPEGDRLTAGGLAVGRGLNRAATAPGASEGVSVAIRFDAARPVVVVRLHLRATHTGRSPRGLRPLTSGIAFGTRGFLGLTNLIRAAGPPTRNSNGPVATFVNHLVSVLKVAQGHLIVSRFAAGH